MWIYIAYIYIYIFSNFVMVLKVWFHVYEPLIFIMDINLCLRLYIHKLILKKTTLLPSYTYASLLCNACSYKLSKYSWHEMPYTKWIRQLMCKLVNLRDVTLCEWWYETIYSMMYITEESRCEITLIVKYMQNVKRMKSVLYVISKFYAADNTLNRSVSNCE